MKKFKLSHLVLYSKGWYERTDDIWSDLKKILTLDDYTPFTNNDVYCIILSRLEDCELSYPFNGVRKVLEGIHPSECWKFGYYTNTCDWIKEYKSLPEYNMPTAFLYYTISNLKFITREDWIPVVPKYSKYPKPKNLELKTVIEFFNSKK